MPSSAFEKKFLRREWFVPLCTEMRTHRSVPRTHTSTARGGRMGLRPRGYWTRVLEGALHVRPLRARPTKGAPAGPQCAHTFHGTCTDTRKLTSDSHARTRAARVRARRRKAHLRGARTQSRTTRTERVHTYHGTHGTAAPIGYCPFSQRAWNTRRGLTAVRQSCALGSGAGTRGRRRLGYGTRTVVGAGSVFLTPRRVLGGYSQGTHGCVRGTTCAGQ